MFLRTEDTGVSKRSYVLATTVDNTTFDRGLVVGADNLAYLAAANQNPDGYMLSVGNYAAGSTVQVALISRCEAQVRVFSDTVPAGTQLRMDDNGRFVTGVDTSGFTGYSVGVCNTDGVLSGDSIEVTINPTYQEN